MFGFLGSLFGFASGGKVSGPGSGTSDSILAWLSNGEYVMNANATSKYLPLLNALNSDKDIYPAFAAGGPVIGPSNAAKVEKLSTEIYEARQNTTNTKQEFNIHITGNIDDQTKKTIYKMLPEIAAGVKGVSRARGDF